MKDKTTMKNNWVKKTLRLKEKAWNDLEELSIQEGTNNVSHEIREAVKDRLKKKLKNN
jgi:hypothetical protein